MPETLSDTVVFRKISNRPTLLHFPMAESLLEQATRTLRVRSILLSEPKLEEATSLDVGNALRQSHIFSTRRTPTRYLRGRSILGSGIRPRLRLLQIEPRLEEATSLDVGNVFRQSHILQLGVRRLTTYEEGPFWAVESTLDLEFFK